MLHAVLYVTISCAGFTSQLFAETPDARNISGRIELPPNERNVPAEVTAILCRDNEVIDVAVVTSGERFTMVDPHPGTPLSLIAMSEGYPPIVLTNLLTLGDDLSVQFTTPLWYRPSDTAATEKYLAAVRMALRQVENAKALLPNDSPYLIQLTRTTTTLQNPRKVDWLIPGYFDPATTAGQAEWQRFASVLRMTDCQNVVVILNVNDGPNRSRIIPEYQKCALQLNNLKVRWVGYIDGKYGNVTARELTDDFDFWTNNYPYMGGVFVDNLPDTYDADGPFDSFCRHVRTQFRKARVRNPVLIGNPGKSCADEFAGKLMFTDLILSERAIRDHSVRTPTWSSSSEKPSFGAIAHGASTTDVAAFFDSIVSQRGQLLYVTDQQVSEKPMWKRLPSDAVLKEFLPAFNSWNATAGAMANYLERDAKYSR